MRKIKEIKNQLMSLRRERNTYERDRKWDLYNQMQSMIDILEWVLEERELSPSG